MKLPKKVKIGGHIYKVVLSKDLSILGETDRNNGTITLRNTVIKSELEATFFHEILHVINNQLGEQMTEALSQQLYQVLKDNKFLR